MDKNKKFELNDNDLESVAGGMCIPPEGEPQCGWWVVAECPHCSCQREAIIGEVYPDDWFCHDYKYLLFCGWCGRSWLENNIKY